MRPRRQTFYLIGLAIHIPQLRTAITHNVTTAWEDVMGPRPRRPWLCRLNLKHYWQWHTNEDGVRYQTCARCGHDRPQGPSPNDPGWWAGTFTPR